MLNLTGFVPVAKSQGLLNTFLTSIDPASINAHLFQNNLTPSPGNLLVDFTEATFTGYAPVSILAADYGGAKVMPDGSILDLLPIVIEFDDGGPAVPNTVYGIYFTDSLNLQLIGSLRFDTPKIMDAIGKFIMVEVGFTSPINSPALAADVTSNG